MQNFMIDGKTVKTHDGKLVLGHCTENRLGWRFLPMTSTHKSSRKSWPTLESCIPAWAKNVAKHYKEHGSILQTNKPG